MLSKTLELQQRLVAFLVEAKRLAPDVDGSERAWTIYTALLTASREMDSGYRRVSISSSPDQFIARISVVARHARQAKASLMLLAQLGYVPIEAARDLILEARGLENIFVAARNTAKRRRTTPRPHRPRR